MKFGFSYPVKHCCYWGKVLLGFIVSLLSSEFKEDVVGEVFEEQTHRLGSFCILRDLSLDKWLQSNKSVRCVLPLV